jgi:hypothetical protein
MISVTRTSTADSAGTMCSVRGSPICYFIPSAVDGPSGSLAHSYCSSHVGHFIRYGDDATFDIHLIDLAVLHGEEILKSTLQHRHPVVVPRSGDTTSLPVYKHAETGSGGQDVDDAGFWGNRDDMRRELALQTRCCHARPSPWRRSRRCRA